MDRLQERQVQIKPSIFSLDLGEIHICFCQGILQTETQQGKVIRPFKTQVLTHCVIVIGVDPNGYDAGFLHIAGQSTHPMEVCQVFF